jgi:hypothetical protein
VPAFVDGSGDGSGPTVWFFCLQQSRFAFSGVNFFCGFNPVLNREEVRHSPSMEKTWESNVEEPI